MMMAMMVFVCTTQPDIMMWFLLNGRQNIVENLKELLSSETVEGDQVVRLSINNQDHVIIVIILSSNCFVLTHINQNYNTLSEVKTRQVVQHF